MQKWFNKHLGRQLSHPKGFWGLILGRLMNNNNYPMYTASYKLLKFKKGDNVLEIGFGNGAFIKEISNEINPGKYFGIDISDTMIKAAQSRNRSLVKSGLVKLIKAGSNKIPFEEGTFDKIFTVNTIYFWKNPEHVMQEVKRLLTPGGILVVALGTKEAMEKNGYFEERFTLYEKQDVLKLFEIAGFSAIESSYNLLKFEDVLRVKGVST